jgi:outer membrane immunogenic protein
MKKILLASLAAAAFASTALAADLPVKAPIMKAPPAPVTSWTGCYLDAGFGYGMYNQDHALESGPPLTPGFEVLETTETQGGRGWLGRFGGGCDYQFASNWLIGAFADYDVMDIKATIGDLGVAGTEKENNAWYAGGRLGYLVTPSLLTYVSGGYTQTHFGSTPLSLAFSPFPSVGLTLASQTYDGWFVGGGTEYALSSFIPIQGLFWRNEYRFAQYEGRDVPLFINATGAVSGIYERQRPSTQTITSSLVWRFNWGGPVTARY